MQRFPLVFLITSLAILHANAFAQTKPLRIVVMDPLAAPLSCACLNGVGQRRYDLLAPWLAKQLRRPIEVVYAESLPLAVNRLGHAPDFVFGQHSVVEFDAVQANLQLQPIARLKNGKGSTQLRGAFVVRKNHVAKSIADLKNAKVLLGPIAHSEAHVFARQALIAAKVEPVNLETAFSIEEAVYAVDDGKAAATIVPDFLFPLLEACGKVEKGDLRIIGHTPPDSFIELFANSDLSAEDIAAVQAALKRVGDIAEIAKPMESQGFVILPLEPAGWTDWRGQNRAGKVANLPKSLPESPDVVWSAEVTGPAMAGISATAKYVVVADKDRKQTTDIFRCFSANTGKTVWSLKYPAAAWLDYTNAPRAQPVIHNNRVYLLGALGDLHCVKLNNGEVIWKRNIAKDFAAETPNWGYASTPLIADGKLIVNPGAKRASLVALNLATGKTVWQTPGNAAAYAPFRIATLGGKRQIVGYDSASAGGWDIATGERLWQVVPPDGTDFNVPTPVFHNGHLMLATENNGARLYGFEKGGKIDPKPIADNFDAAPDTCTPAISGDNVYLNAYGVLYCLDLKNNLKTRWEESSDFFHDHNNMIVSDDRLLIWTTTGDLLLIDTRAPKYKLVSKWQPFGEEVESMSHPAFVGDRIYLRSDKKLICVKLR